MSYFNYHATAKKLISENKLIDFYFAKKHNQISPALVLVFNDYKHPIMPIREERWSEYLSLINNRKKNISGKNWDYRCCKKTNKS